MLICLLCVLRIFLTTETWLKQRYKTVYGLQLTRLLYLYNDNMLPNARSNYYNIAGRWWSSNSTAGLNTHSRSKGYKKAWAVQSQTATLREAWTSGHPTYAAAARVVAPQVCVGRRSHHVTDWMRLMKRKPSCLTMLTTVLLF